MGKKKGKRGNNKWSNSPMSSPSPMVIEKENAKIEESDKIVEIPLNRGFKEHPPKHAYQTVYMSHENVTSSANTATEKTSGGLNRSTASIPRSGGSHRSSYQQLMDGGAYEQFHTSNQSVHSHGGRDFERESAGDRVIAGSRRSISHRSLFSDVVEKPKTSASFHFDESGDEQVRISRAEIEIPLETRRPYTRSRTVSSSSRPVSGSLGVQPLYNSHKEIDGNFLGEDVRTYHAGSEYLQNRLSKLSIHSNNDEFVLVGGHPPVESISNDSHISEAYGDHTDHIYHSSMPNYESEASNFGDSKELHFYPPSEGASSHTNTDDRLLLAARYSQSPEAEGLLSVSQSALSRSTSQTLAPPTLSHSRSTINEKVGFVEMPTLFSHPDDNFNDENEAGEPFRPTAEHKSTPTSASSRSRLDRSGDVVPPNTRFSSSSSLSQEHQQSAPSRALLVTSALTPVIPKRHTAYSRSQSNDSIAPETPQTVQRAHNKSQQHEPMRRATTTEMAVQTGNSIRLRQNPCVGGHDALSVLSEKAYLPPAPPAPHFDCNISTMRTSSYFPDTRKSQEIVEIPAATPKPVLIQTGASPLTTFRSRLRNISDRYTSLGSSSVHEISIPSPTTDTTSSSSVPFKKEAASEISVPKTVVEKAPKQAVELAKNPSETTISGRDTIRKHIPRGRIRDLADAFNKMDVGSPLRPAGFKYEVQIERPASRADDSYKNEPLVSSSSSRLNGSSSTAFRSSTQTLPLLSSQEERRRSTSSSLHHHQNQPHHPPPPPSHQQREQQQQQHVFTRNTFLSQSSIRPEKARMPSSVAMSSSYSRSQEGSKDGGFVSEFEKFGKKTSGQKQQQQQNTSRTSEPQFAEYATKFDIPVRLEVPIVGTKRRLVPSMRAKTQEVPSALKFDPKYESRAASGDLSRDENVFALQKPSFGRETAEDLTAHRKWTTTTSSSSEALKHNHPTYITTTTTHTYNTEYQIDGGDRREAHHGLTSPRQQPYSPPVTEDAGSRITHHTATTTQDDLFAHTEDSSIRGKIDRMFDFVESDDSRKTMRGDGGVGGGEAPSHASTDTIGTAKTHKYRHHPHNQDSFIQKHANHYNPPSQGGPQSSHRSPYKETPMDVSRMKTPERRATITGVGSEMEHFDSELEYSLSQYREMQREQLRRRLPSADEPQFFRSPLLSAAHAGQSMHAYRTKDFLGTPAAGEKVRIPSSTSTLGASHKFPLATSTPIDSPQSRASFSVVKDQHSELINNTNNQTFVSSISGVSAIEKHADVMRKINRLSYMIENTQKQMSMNEAALADALKKGRRSQEIAAHRSILISRETLRLQRNELRRLHAFSAVRRPPPPVAKELRGSVVFKNLTVQLNKLFVSRLTTKDVSDNSYSFVGLFKFGHQVEATELVPLRVFPGGTSPTDDKLYFEKQIQFSDVPIDFMVSIEIYAMRITPAKPVELSIGSSLANKCKSLMGPPQKKNVPTSTETAFKFRGRLVLDRDAAGDRCLYLDDVTYPLEGTVMITTQCSRLPESFEVDFRGFLTMFHTVSNMASWERYWAVLRRGVVFFWKYPDDEQMGREPKMQIDLTKCTNNTIEKCGFDLCPRSNSFAIEILVDTEDGTIGSVVEKKRVLLSTDSSEMMAQWLFTLNQTLDVIRGPI